MHKLTTLDFPGVVSAILFTQGCNFHCPYCHNAFLIPASGAEPLRPQALLDFLKKRRGLLDGLVISGGEPTLQGGLADFCRAVKGMGYKIKLDTNGNRPKVLAALLHDGLVDYLAMDCKTASKLYHPHFSAEAGAAGAVRESAALLRASGLPHEFRTTCVKPYLTRDLLPQFLELIGRESPWFLQKALFREGMRAGAFEPVSEEDISELAAEAGGMGMRAQVR